MAERENLGDMARRAIKVGWKLGDPVEFKHIVELTSRLDETDGQVIGNVWNALQSTKGQLRVVKVGLRRVLGDDALAKMELPDLVVHLAAKVKTLEGELDSQSLEIGDAKKLLDPRNAHLGLLVVTKGVRDRVRELKGMVAALEKTSAGGGRGVDS